MKRDLSRFDRGPFDLLVIGGGIYGAWTAYDAALRGLSVALIDKGDWASGTSSASTKLIHGGLRYLERYRFGLVRKSLAERARLMRLAPHAVHPLSFVVPSYRGDRVARWRLRAGLWLYDLLAGSSHHSRSLDRRDTLGRGPFLESHGLRGGFLYSDCQVDDARLVLEIIDGAWQRGVAAANYVEAVELLTVGGRVRGAAARDRLGGASFDIEARVVVNAAGPWAPAVAGNHSKIRLVKGAHLVMPSLPASDAFLFMTRRDQRVLFLVPWYGRTLLGTTDTDFSGSPDEARATQQDVDYLLTEVRSYVGDTWSEQDVIARFAGVRALQSNGEANPSNVTREWLMEEPRSGLIVSIGGKYTSARADAAHIVDRALVHLGRRGRGAQPTAERPLPWSPSSDVDGWLRTCVDAATQYGLSRSDAELLARRHGSRTDATLARLRQDPHLAQRIVPDLPFLAVELAWAVDEEMALTLEDIVRRRIPSTILSDMDTSTLRRIAQSVAPLLKWAEDDIEDEVRRVVARPPVSPGT